MCSTLEKLSIMFNQHVEMKNQVRRAKEFFNVSLKEQVLIELQIVSCVEKQVDVCERVWDEQKKELIV